ncbi:hypothetical protein ACO0QE_004603 [Hanseniaspora vineae]
MKPPTFRHLSGESGESNKSRSNKSNKSSKSNEEEVSDVSSVFDSNMNTPNQSPKNDNNNNNNNSNGGSASSSVLELPMGKEGVSGMVSNGILSNDKDVNAQEKFVSVLDPLAKDQSMGINSPLLDTSATQTPLNNTFAAQNPLESTSTPTQSAHEALGNPEWIKYCLMVERKKKWCRDRLQGNRNVNVADTQHCVSCTDYSTHAHKTKLSHSASALCNTCTLNKSTFLNQCPHCDYVADETVIYKAFYTWISNASSSHTATQEPLIKCPCCNTKYELQGMQCFEWRNMFYLVMLAQERCLSCFKDISVRDEQRQEQQLRGGQVSNSEFLLSAIEQYNENMHGVS